MPTLKDVNQLRLTQYQLKSFDSRQLIVIGAHDLSYHHDVELVFTNVQHINCDADFYDPEFHELGPCPCGCSGRRIGITGGRAEFEIIALDLEIAIGVVFHYERENLQRGEKIAPWVKKAN